MGIFIILIAYVVIVLPGTRALYAIEGEEAKLPFTYPCESTLITLRLNNRAPFYTSTNQESTQLPPNYAVTDQKDTRHGDSCTLHLTINPVSREDEGTFILMSYTDDIAYEFIRIWLSVGYPPGIASCESRRHFHEGWVSLLCKAPEGNVPGRIMCYQSGTKIPPYTAPKEKDGILYQSFLARVVGDPVYCCSSFLEQTKDRCECKDWVWDPVHNISTTHKDPCLRTLPSDSRPSHKPSDPMNNDHISSSSGSLNDENTRGSSWHKYDIIGVLTSSIVLLIYVRITYFKVIQRRRKGRTIRYRQLDKVRSSVVTLKRDYMTHFTMSELGEGRT